MAISRNRGVGVCCFVLAVGPAFNTAAEDEAAATSAVAKDATVQETNEPSVRYLPLDAPAGMSQAVVVQGLPLVHTRQLLAAGW